MNRVAFEKQPVQVQDLKKITHHFRGLYGIYPQNNEEKLQDVNMYTDWTWKQ
jgi:hypothetical protein